MKRSEMKKILEIHIRNQFTFVEDPDYEAGIILTIIESNGMMPPYYTCINPQNPKKHFAGSCKLLQWEPEDETD